MRIGVVVPRFRRRIIVLRHIRAVDVGVVDIRIVDVRVVDGGVIDVGDVVVVAVIIIIAIVIIISVVAIVIVVIPTMAPVGPTIHDVVIVPITAVHQPPTGRR